MDLHVLGGGPRAYLAHTPLLQMVPSLRDDIGAMPYFPGEAELNVWFGPAGTVTPLHFDPLDNVFVQVVGQKCIVLHEESQSHLLYANTGNELTNTSLVQVESPDSVAHPLYASAEGSVTVLNPGDAIYVPRGCWHHVRSLQPSWSVSFWAA